ncbi:MAG: STAS domain-containing protein [Rhodothermaceae bacterium]|nr:STAS domain-containing protein [Rhodothermaceae bacterium]
MRIDKKIQDSIVLLSLEGNLFGGPQSTELCTTFQELLDGENKHVVLDVSGLSWLSIAGTGILVSALTSFKNRGGDLKLLGATQDVKEQLERSSFDSIFEHYDRLESAIAAY